MCGLVVVWVGGVVCVGVSGVETNAECEDGVLVRGRVGSRGCARLKRTWRCV